ncbi:MAG: hypothetical protein AAGD10_02620 [Myxococcota bacterium]
MSIQLAHSWRATAAGLALCISAAVWPVEGAWAASKGVDVVQVNVRGDEGARRFSVTLRSPDAGCERYADWWEVLDAEGKLLYRRILAHSHVDEQPFTRSGGPVRVGASQLVYVRAHMNVGGYGGQAMKGTVEKGFKAITGEVPADEEVERAPPQPKGCAF